MRVEEFYLSACPTVFEKSKDAHSHALEIEKRIPQLVEKPGDSAAIRDAVDASDFQFEWQKEKALEQDVLRWNRFLRWLGNAEVIDTNREVSVTLSATLPDGSRELTQNIPVIVRKNGTVSAILIRNRCADKSMGGKSVHTAILTDLGAMTAKAALEPEYPGITVNVVYLKNVDDTDNRLVPELICGETKKSNVFTVPYRDYVKNGVFDVRCFSEVLSRVVETPQKRSCYDCPYGTECKSGSIVPFQTGKSVAEREKSYQMPEYTREQLAVIYHRNGAMRVCAGPGSGKTATLVGRVKKLIESGVVPQTILLITFTKEAANEILKRCESFCPAGELPTICTLNALGFEILRCNPDALGFTPTLLTEVEKMKIIKNLLSITSSLNGFSSEELYGKSGLLKTLGKKLDEWKKATPAQFNKENPDLGEDFQKFASRYTGIITARGFISYDEQVSLSVKVLKEHPEVCTSYRNRFHYTMVDEFQDVNHDQWTLVRLIARDNLVVVGDDDQAIYGFRGADSRYMLSFGEFYPDTKTVVLHENFRSDAGIVQCANRVIEHNYKRIPKNLKSKKGTGREPQIIRGTSPSDFDKVVAELVQEGYRYGDIAILSTKNVPLEELEREMKSPTILAKEPLRTTPLFGITHAVLSMHMGIEQTMFQRFLLLNGVKEIIPFHFAVQRYGDPRKDFSAFSEEKEDPVYMAMRALSSAFLCLSREDLTPDQFILALAYLYGQEESEVMQGMSELLSERCIQTLDTLFEVLDFMVKFEDDTRVEESGRDAVTLITCHESKGKEYPVVLIKDDYGEISEESRRVFYVALTRAKERVMVLTDQDSIFLKELSA